jgi:hypothetical protein
VVGAFQSSGKLFCAGDGLEYEGRSTFGAEWGRHWGEYSLRRVAVVRPSEISEVGAIKERSFPS